MEKKTNWKCQSDWEEFHKTYPDPSRFRLFIASDPTLIKIFNFCSVPSIWEDVRKFPFDDKIEELELISEDEKDYLSEAPWKEKDKQKQDWLEYLGNMFDIVRSTVMFKKKLDSENKQLHSTYNRDQILEMVKDAFDSYISVNNKFTSTNSERIWIIGKWYPLCARVVHQQGADVQFKIYHYFLQPESIEKSFNWDVYSVITYQKYLLSELFEIDTSNLTIQHYYDGKPLLDEPFKFQIAKRYEPLLKASAKKMKKLGLIEDFKQEKVKSIKDLDSSLAEAKFALFEAVKKFNPAKGPPANYFYLYLKEYYPGNLFDNLSTVAGDRPCKSFCKESKRLKEDLPCEYETENGWCTDPHKKRQFLSAIEASGGSLDEPIVTEEGDENGSRKDKVPDDSLNQEEILINKEQNFSIQHSIKDVIHAKLKKDKRMNRILKQEKLSDKDRQYKSRWIKKQKKSIAE